MIQGATKQAKKSAHMGSGARTSIEPILKLVEAFFGRISTQVFLVRKVPVSNIRSTSIADLDSKAIGGDIDHSLADVISPMLKLRITSASPKWALSSIQEARETLLRLALQYRRDLSMSQSASLGARFETWTKAFETFRRTLNFERLSKIEKRSIALLELHKRYLYINIAALNQPDREDPSMWDQWTEQFQEMLEYAIEASGLDNKRSQATREPQFYMEVGILPALFFLCTKCRDPELRRRAIEIMRSNQIQEGMWNSEMAVKVAQRVISLEEGNAVVESSKQIDDAARVRRIAVHAGPEVSYLNVGYELHCGWVQEELD